MDIYRASNITCLGQSRESEDILLIISSPLKYCPWTLSGPRTSQFSSSYAFENCSLLGTDNAPGQKIYPSIYSPQMEAIVYIFPNIQNRLCYKEFEG